jgi:hypothetical protein
MKTIRLSKQDAVRRQLLVGIRMYFNGGDIVAIHTLAAAAFGVVKQILDASGSPDAPSQWVAEVIKPEYYKRFWTALNKTANFLKHADQDPSAFHEFTPTETENLLFLAAYHYRSFTGDSPPEIIAMIRWYFMNNPAAIPERCAEYTEGKRLFGNDKELYWKSAMALALEQQF